MPSCPKEGGSASAAGGGLDDVAEAGSAAHRGAAGGWGTGHRTGVIASGLLTCGPLGIPVEALLDLLDDAHCTDGADGTWRPAVQPTSARRPTTPQCPPHARTTFRCASSYEPGRPRPVRSANDRMLFRMTTDIETGDPWDDPDWPGEPFGGYPWTATPETAAEHLAGRRDDGALVIDPSVIAGLAATGVISQSLAGIPSRDLDHLMLDAHRPDDADGTLGYAVAGSA